MSKHGNRKNFDLEWIERWARTVNDDRIFQLIGRFFNGKFVLGIDETEYLVEVRAGKIQRIADEVTLSDLGYDFALKAPSSAWSKFCQQIPPPMFNDIWAMIVQKHLLLEGNTLPFWQNMRALMRMLSLMRQI